MHVTARPGVAPNAMSAVGDVVQPRAKEAMP